MTNYWNWLKSHLGFPDSNDHAEVDRVAALQKAAVIRRAEYAKAVELNASTVDTVSTQQLSSSLKRMKSAEAEHIAALQRWENKQAKQKSH